MILNNNSNNVHICCRFTVSDLNTAGKFVLDLNIEIYFEDGQVPSYDIPVLENIVVSKQPCVTNPGFRNQSECFSIEHALNPPLSFVH